MTEPESATPFLSHVERNLDAPLYAQIQRDIQIGIATNKFKPGDTVPGEIDLANRYQVSRVTVRQAIGELVAAGLLYRIQGKGTFVAAPMIERAEPNVTSFFYEMVESGRQPRAKAWSEVAKPDPETARKLELKPGERVIVTQRLRYVNGEPIAYQVNATRHSLCPGLEKEDFSAQSFQYTLEVKYGIRIVEVEESLTSIKPDDTLAILLSIPPTMPVLLDTRRHHGPDGVIIGKAQTYFRGDRYTFKIVRQLTPTGE